MPATEPPNPRVLRSPAESPSGGIAAPRSVLIVDDNLQNLELLQAYLEDLDCPIRTARDGQECLNQVAAEQPDLDRKSVV